MKVMNSVEMQNVNGGIGYFGAYFTCGVCDKRKRVYDWRFLFWSKSDCQTFYETQHWNNGGANFVANPH